jgi:(p)ppGpp synthase/HD superfamily hydrolase
MNASQDQDRAARDYATQKHEGQFYGKQPYTVHLVAVREVLRWAGFEDGHPLAIAAWLHDTVEDTGATREDVAARFGDDVAALVWAVTGIGKNRKERNEDAYAKIRAYPPAATLKLADRIANVEASANVPDKLAMYRNEWPAFRAALEGIGLPPFWERLEKALGIA